VCEYITVLCICFQSCFPLATSRKKLSALAFLCTGLVKTCASEQGVCAATIARASKLLFYWKRQDCALQLTAMALPNAACPYRDQLGCERWQHVFSDSLQLSALTELETAHGPTCKASDLDRLVSSCSHLQKLSLHCTPRLQLRALLQLTELVQLWLRGKPDSSTMASLAQLSALQRLQRLAVTGPYPFSDRLFKPLTAFTQLTYLALPYYSESGSNMQQLLLQLCGKPSHVIDRWPDASRSVITSAVSE